MSYAGAGDRGKGTAGDKIEQRFGATCQCMGGHENAKDCRSQLHVFMTVTQGESHDPAWFRVRLIAHIQGNYWCYFWGQIGNLLIT